MLVASTSMVKINRLAQLTWKFEMKDPESSKTILSIEIHKDGIDGKFWVITT